MYIVRSIAAALNAVMTYMDFYWYVWQLMNTKLKVHAVFLLMTLFSSHTPAQPW